MILNQLTLSNFSAFGRKQTLNLAPNGDSKPIVLVGGLNGAGKTSILTAIRLALYGKRAVTLEDNKSGYTKLLHDLIHDRKNGAMIELEFSTYSYGVKKEYCVKREWVEKKGKIKESFTVWYNGAKDTILTATWDEYVDALLPASISHLFFFDGEKVSEFATSKGTANLLKTGVKSLLGVDILERLRDDLADLIHDKASLHKENKLFAEINKTKIEIEELKSERFSHKLEKGKLRNKLERLKNDLAKQEQHLKEIGADLFLMKKAIEKDFAESKNALDKVSHELIEISSSSLPLLLVTDLINKVKNQDQTEHKAFQAQLILEELKTRDQELIGLLEEANVEGLSRVKKFIKADISKRTELANTNSFLNISEEARSTLSSLNFVLGNDRKKACDLLEQHKYWSNKVSILSRKVQMIPSEKIVSKSLAVRESLTQKIQLANDEMMYLDRQIDTLKGNINYKEQERSRILKKDVSLQLQHDEDQRIMVFAEKARERASQFEKRVVNKSIEKLESIILECARLLFRKNLFICELTINPDTYELSLFKENGNMLLIDSLSSGERQILIIAVLWGLARASGRPLPLIVDTPLGRLDSEHRNNLIDRYYSTASHQVVLLSTDTEIDTNLLSKIENHMSHSYLLEHNSANRQTTIKNGYFWS